MGRHKKSDILMNEILEHIQAPQKKRGRPKKVQDIPLVSHIEVDKEKFNEERGRIIRYLEGISSRKISAFEAISILEDLGVIVNTYDLKKEEILSQLQEELKKGK